MLVKSLNLTTTPLVSVIICSFNRINMVSETIDSILAQNCEFEYEIVIGDDASFDEVKNILLDYQNKYPERIVLLLHEKNVGLGANWAYCVKLCRGKYLANCDNDDFWHNPEKLALQVKFMEQNNDYGMIHTNFRELSRQSGRTSEKTIHIIKYSEPIISAIFYGRFKCCNSSVMYRKSLLDKFIITDDYIKYQFPLQDWNTWISLAKYTKIHCLPVSTTTVGIDSASITRSKDIEGIRQRFVKEKIMYRYLCEHFPDDLNFDEKAYDEYVIQVLLKVAIRNGDFPNARILRKFALESDMVSYKPLITSNFINFYAFYALKKIKDFIVKI